MLGKVSLGFVLLGLIYSLGASASGRETGPLKGVVVDANQKPIVGAEVTLFAFDLEDNKRPKQAGQTKADAQGRFEFDSGEVGFSALRVKAESFAPAFSYVRSGENTITLRPPVVMTVTVQDPAGKPLAGARWREFQLNYGTGDFRTFRQDLATYGHETSVSDASGKIRTPILPDGVPFSGTIEHPDFAAFELIHQKVAAGVEPTLKLLPGVPVSLHIANAAEMGVKEVDVELYPQSYEKHWLSVRRNPYPLNEKQQVRLTLDKGPYTMLELKHRDFVITPLLSPDYRFDQIDLTKCDINRQPFTLHKKLKVKGRFVSTEGNHPVADVYAIGEIPNEAIPELEKFRGSAWAEVGVCESDAEGRFEVTLAPGPARIEIQSQTHSADSPFVSVDVKEDGSTVIPDIKLSPIPRVRGRVIAADGRPATKCVVRFRGLLKYQSPVVTDAEGRFELPQVAIPHDPYTEKQMPVQPIIAFDAYHPDSGIVEVDLGNKEAVGNVQIVLKRGKWEDPLADIGKSFSAWERGEIPDNMRNLTVASLKDKPAPDLEGLTWFNTKRPSMKLADFHGQCLVLDFWFIGCGPCAGEEPANKLLWDLYKDRGFSLIGVHDNSSNPEEVRRYAAKNGLTYPQAVDHHDGRMVAAYKINSFPSFLLLDRQGRILHDDDSMPGPNLRNFRIEIVRSLVMGHQDEK